MRTRLRVRLAAALCVVTVVCCRPDDIVEYNCSDVGRAGIIITLQDSANSAQSIFSNVTATANDGTRIEVLTYSLIDRTQRGQEIAMAISRAGRYLVTVTANGYAAWQKSDVVVALETGPCPNVIPVALTARLQPL